MKRKILIAFILLSVVGSFFLFQIYFSKSDVTIKKSKASQFPTLTIPEVEDKEVPAEKIDTSKWLSADEEINFPIINYSGVENSPTTESANIGIDTFSTQLNWLSENNYYTLSPQETYLVLTTNKKPAEKIAWLTFDNSYLSGYDLVYPLLQKYSAKATFFYMPEKKNNFNYINLYDMQEMKNSTLIAIQTHANNSVNLANLSLKDQTEHLTTLKNSFDQELNQKTISFSYPQTDNYNNDTIKAVGTAGFQLAVTNNTGLASKSDGLHSLDRITITQDMSLEYFQQMIENNY